jgi:hypothetical protein
MESQLGSRRTRYLQCRPHVNNTKHSPPHEHTHSLAAGVILVIIGGTLCFGLLRLTVAIGEFAAAHAHAFVH